MDITKYNTIIFDCDGVLLNSNFKKSEAYRYAAIDFGATKEQAEDLVQYHVENTGISRYVKFEYFLTNILQQSFNEEHFSFLIKSLNHHVLKILNDCEVAAGLDKLRELTKNQHWMVMSGGDQEEVRTILASKHLDHLFDYGIYGSPDSKHEIVKHHLESNNNFMPAIFFGDAEYDIKTAKNFNLDFVFISGWSDFSAWEETVKAENIISVKHLKDLII